MLDGRPATAVMDKALNKKIRKIEIDSKADAYYSDARDQYPELSVGRFPVFWDDKLTRIKDMREEQLVAQVAARPQAGRDRERRDQPRVCDSRQARGSAGLLQVPLHG